MRRRSSRRSINRNWKDDPSFRRASDAARAIQYEEGEPSNDLTQAWQKDELSSEEFKAILPGTNKQDEVLEQYRMMAQIEARMRVKENTGFDMEEYERRRKLIHPKPSQRDYLYGIRKPEISLPVQRDLPSGYLMKAEEPPLPIPRTNRLYNQGIPSTSIKGVFDGIVDNETSVPEGEYLVQCLGCKLKLRVKLLASMVKCPECSTISPATSFQP